MPYFPEPHLFGKIRWVLGGAKGMQTMDWLDLAWHSAPFFYLIYVLAFAKKHGKTTSN